MKYRSPITVRNKIAMTQAHVISLNPKPVTLPKLRFLGQEPPPAPMTLADAAEAAGVSVSAISYRKRHHGLTTEQAAMFTTRAAVARKHGIKKSTIYMRMRTKGLTFEEALAFKSRLSPRGPNTITRRALAAGMCPTTVHRRMVRHGMTLDEALSFPPTPNRQPLALRKAA